MMKDLKHYFPDNSRACETSKVNEVTRGGANDNNASDDEQVRANFTRKKRGRVKIKISQTDSRGRVCDIVDSKNDLIDKTPSPFAPRDLKSDGYSRNDTPKRSNSLPRNSSKIVNSNGIASSSKSENKIKNSGDENDNLISNMAEIEKNDSSMENVNSSKIEIERESNAFQVLMMRKKSIQYKVPSPMTQEDEELAAKVAEEARLKLKQNKEKLIAIADKKGYTKRKINEIEEGEMIERRLEKRAKVFKQMGKKESDGKNSPDLGKRVSPGSLHNYFSKAIPEKGEKESTIVSSTVMVEAEVHVPNSLIPVKIKEITGTKKLMRPNDKKIKESLAKMDLIEVVKSPVEKEVVNEELNATQRCNTKSRWALRINLHGNDRENENALVVENDEKTSRGKRESKPRRSKVKTKNYEENESSDGSSVKSSRKKKSSSNGKNVKSSSNTKIQSSEMQIESLPAIIVTEEKKKIAETEEPEIIEIKIVHRPPEKLAPLFVKRQKLDPAVLEARRAFLHSVPEENANRKNDRKDLIVGTPLLPFPTISHVTQLDPKAKIDNLSFKSIFPTRNIRPYVPSFDLRDFKSITSLEKEESKKSNDSMETIKSNVEEVLSEIETRYSEARELWTRISSKLAKPEESRISPKRQRGKKRKSAEKKNETIRSGKSNHDCTWTQKYRPTSTRDIVGNEEAAEKFRKWLNGWKINSQKDENYSSGDEFYSSDCSFVSNVDNNQVAVLLGPHGSGKTASVYAIAEELGYSVLEVNASSKRAGKKILKELEEATKSHRIKKPEVVSLKSITSGSEKIVPQNSLILVEDVDLIFEEDEGFISATCQLASNTKRPIVMTGRDTCAHLNRMAPQQLRIYYQSTVGSRVATLLELITLAESGCRLPKPCLDLLLQNGDLRKALLQLQYLLLSGKPSISDVSTSFHQSLWQDMRQCLYKPAIRATKKTTKKKLENNEKSSLKKENTIVDRLAHDLENLSFLSTLIEIDDPALEFSRLKVEPSLSLDENIHHYSSVHSTSYEIAKWLRDHSMSSRETIDYGSDLQNFRQISLKRELNVGVNLALSQVSPYTLDHRSMKLDYLSSVRTICRTEEARTSINNKRGNRFFHYLQNLRLPALSTRPSILAAACKIMYDKNSES